MSTGDRQAAQRAEPIQSGSAVQHEHTAAQNQVSATKFSTGGANPPVMQGWSEPPPSASDLAFGQHAAETAPATSPVQSAQAGSSPPSQLPGEMITVTLLAKDTSVIARTSVPLYGEASLGVFVGDVVNGAIRWHDESITVELGTKFDAAHHPVGGVTLETWVRQHGRGCAYVIVEVDGASAQPAEKGAEKKAWFEDEDTAALQRASSVEPTASGSGTAAASARQAQPGPGGADVDTHEGTTTTAGHQGSSKKENGQVRGSRITGNARGASGGHDGGALGKSDGNKQKVGYFWDPDHAGQGDQDLAPASASAGGMLGGEGKRGDQGVPDSWSMKPLIKVPKRIAGAVSVAAILMQGDITGAADDLVSLARQLGTTATTKALGPFVAAKIDRIVERELPNAVRELGKDSEFAARSLTEQSEIARQALRQEATTKLRQELDSRIANSEGAAQIDCENLSGRYAEYAKAELDQEEQTLAATRRVRDAVSSQDVETGANANSPGAASPSSAATDRATREKALAADPAQGGAVTAKTKREVEVGLALEESGDLPAPIERDPSGRAEFIDGAGQRWDVKQFNSKFPPKRGGFVLEKALATIQRELNAGENVIVDTVNMSAEHIAELRDAVAKRGWSNRVKWH